MLRVPHLTGVNDFNKPRRGYTKCGFPASGVLMTFALFTAGEDCVHPTSNLDQPQVNGREDRRSGSYDNASSQFRFITDGDANLLRVNGATPTEFSLGLIPVVVSGSPSDFSWKVEPQRSQARDSILLSAASFVLEIDSEVHSVQQKADSWFSNHLFRPVLGSKTKERAGSDEGCE